MDGCSGPWGAQLGERFGPRRPFIITAGASLAILLPIWFRFKVPGKGLEPAPPPAADSRPQFKLIRNLSVRQIARYQR